MSMTDPTAGAQENAQPFLPMSYRGAGYSCNSTYQQKQRKVSATMPSIVIEELFLR